MTAARRALHAAGREDGALGMPLEMALGIGMLMLPAMVVVAFTPFWLAAQNTVTMAAREAARTGALEDTPALAVSRGEAAGVLVLDNHNVPAGDRPSGAVTVTTPNCGGQVCRGGEVTATATIRAPEIPLPFVDASFGQFTVTSTHVERIDDYRSIG